MLAFRRNGDTLALHASGHPTPLWEYSAAHPGITLWQGRPEVVMVRGNFRLTDQATPEVPLRAARCTGPDEVVLAPAAEAPAALRLRVDGHRVVFEPLDAAFNRCAIRIPAAPDEQVWGCGTQLSYLALRGRRFPLWASEPGVGRDPSRELTRAMDAAALAGGDYFTTNYPQPTILSSSGYAVHVDCDAYQCFDFTAPDAHRLEAWAIPAALEVFLGEPLALVEQLSRRFGRQPMLPGWATDGAIIGLKGGVAGLARFDAMRAAGVAVSGLWCEDWCGIRETSFGRRLFWDWRWQPTRYPDLPARIAALREEGIAFVGYVNPYLAVDGTLYAEARAAGFLVMRVDDDVPYDVDFGEFRAGLVDLTHPAATRWFQDRVLGRELIDLGLAGWMADFGEYLPPDVRLHSGADPLLEHNRWPVRWARVNADAVAAAGRTGEVAFFMRAGWSGIGRHCPLLWAGDQLVDFSRHDGLNTALTAALSAGLVGNAWHHADCGGYTSVAGIVRTPELLQRWCDFTAFTPVMRSHEGNRPDDNLQVDGTPELLAHFARMTRLHAALVPYVRAAGADAQDRGLPLVRALFLHHPEDRTCWTIQDQYLYGRDLLVAPVVTEGVSGRAVYLPADAWLGFYDGAAAAPGWHTVEAPPGRPPVFVRAAAPLRELLLAVGRAHAATEPRNAVMTRSRPPR
ncbi:MAG: alpha-glucosidase [Planctomycetes bacterium]|nr:alpha-glucosidase [Planctomycetota bacterium]